MAYTDADLWHGNRQSIAILAELVEIAEIKKRLKGRFIHSGDITCPA